MVSVDDRATGHARQSITADHERLVSADVSDWTNLPFLHYVPNEPMATRSQRSAAYAAYDRRGDVRVSR